MIDVEIYDITHKRKYSCVNLGRSFNFSKH